MECKIYIVLFFGLVVQCLSMSLSELEDFANYLKRTSHLDETLKKGTDPHDFDEDESISDDAWEESGKFEGDLVLNDRQRRMIVEDIAEGLSRNGLRDSTKRWPDNEVIYYIQKEHFSEDQVDAIQNGIDDLSRASCIKFRPYKKGDRDAVVIQGSRRGCFSQVGYQGGYQVLNLSGRHPVGRGCFRHGTVVHELLHTLGFYHMQSSPDRDEFVDIVWENIVQPARHNFRKYNAFSVSDFGVGYDYDSVLHYSRRAFSNNGQDTIVPKQSGAHIGQRTGLSDKDTQKLNKMYCDTDSNNDEEENTTKKSTQKKKIPKNKPFKGHGIGYHQGKTMVIKLLPAEKAKTYALVNEPEFQMFDYFSKAPEILSAEKIEGFGVDKSVAELYKPQYIEIVEVQPGKENALPQGQTELDKSHENNSTKDQSIEQDKSLEDEQDPVSDLSDPFNSLSKILKTHVYPSQTPDFRAYKLNTDYKDFYNTKKIPKFAYDFMPSRNESNEDDKATEEEGSSNNNSKDSYDSEYSEEYNKENEKINKNNLTEASFENEENNSKERDVKSYRTSYPFRLYQHISNGSIELTTPDYSKYDSEEYHIENQKVNKNNLTEASYENEDNNLKEIDVKSYRTSYPVRLHQHVSNGSIKFKTPDNSKYDSEDYHKENQIQKVNKKNVTGASYENDENESYPFRLHQHVSIGSIESKTPDYDYSKQYSSFPSTENQSSKEIRPYNLLSEPVLIYDGWYKNEDKKHIPDTYDHYVPTDKSIHKRLFDSGSEKSYDDFYPESYSPPSKESYRFSSVPVSNDWYKDNYRKIRDKYSKPNSYIPQDSFKETDFNKN